MTYLASVFICLDDESVIVKDADSVNCPVCDSLLESTGHMESVDQ